MSDWFLGIIAISVLVMAVIQVTAIVVALLFIRRLEQMVGRLEREIRPVVASLKALSADATRATSAFRSVLSIFRSGRKDGSSTAHDEEGPLFVG